MACNTQQLTNGTLINAILKQNVNKVKSLYTPMNDEGPRKQMCGWYTIFPIAVTNNLLVWDQPDLPLTMKRMSVNTSVFPAHYTHNFQVPWIHNSVQLEMILNSKLVGCGSFFSYVQVDALIQHKLLCLAIMLCSLSGQRPGLVSSILLGAQFSRRSWSWVLCWRMIQPLLMVLVF